jgi:hypothetical protein
MLTVAMAAGIVAVVAAAGVGLAVHLLRVGIGRADLPELQRPVKGATRPVHRSGVTWAEAGVPPRRHLCWSQTGAWASTGPGVAPRWFEMCPCGGMRRDGGRWEHRNTERRRTTVGVGDDWPMVRAAGGRC